jgi:aerobic-type carbon monoxide dehydrogenase small subunit (CoxS/CutS family)
MTRRVSLTVNGATKTVDVDPDMPLLYALRDDLKMNNPHFGCGLGQCGACTVLVNGEPTRSCQTPVGSVEGRAIVTLVGLGTPEKPHPVQQAYVEEGVVQCGYCASGWVLTAAAMLAKNPKPSDAQIRDGLAGLKCRCGTHMAIFRAVRRAGRIMAG